MKSKIPLDPRQSQAIANYKDPMSDTFGNFSQALIKAGYKKKYVDHLDKRSVGWIAENIINDVKLVKGAEDNLKRIVNLKVPLDTKLNVDIARLQVDVSKFITERLAKGKYGKSEDKAQVHGDIQINYINYSKDKEPRTLDADTID